MIKEILKSKIFLNSSGSLAVLAALAISSKTAYELMEYAELLNKKIQEMKEKIQEIQGRDSYILLTQHNFHSGSGVKDDRSLKECKDEINMTIRNAQKTVVLVSAVMASFLTSVGIGATNFLLETNGKNPPAVLTSLKGANMISLCCLTPLAIWLSAPRGCNNLRCKIVSCMNTALSRLGAKSSQDHNR